MSTAVTVYDGIGDPLEWIKFTGAAIAKSGMFGCQSIDQGHVIALECAAQKCTPFSLARRNDIIQGKLAMKADAMLGAFNSLGGKHEIKEYSPDACEILFSIDKQKLQIRISWADAQQERWPYKGDGKTLKDNWSTPIGKQDMLWARVVSRGVRKLKPEIVAGYYTPEEVVDFIDVQSAPIEEKNGEALMKAAAPAESIVDAEFEVTPEPAVVKPAVPTNTITAAQPQSAALPGTLKGQFDPQSESTLERADATKIRALGLLLAQAKISQEQARVMIEMHAGQGNRMKDLTPAGADHLAERLNQLIAAGVFGKPTAAAPEGEATKGVNAAAPPSGVNGHMSKVQLEQIGTIAKALEKHDPEIQAKLAEIVRKAGKSRLGELSREAGDKLLTTLYGKIKMHEQASVKN